MEYCYFVFITIVLERCTSKRERCCKPINADLEPQGTSTVFDLIGARGAFVNLFSTTSAKRSSNGR